MNTGAQRFKFVAGILGTVVGQMASAVRPSGRRNTWNLLALLSLAGKFDLWKIGCADLRSCTKKPLGVFPSCRRRRPLRTIIRLVLLWIGTILLCATGCSTDFVAYY